MTATAAATAQTTNGSASAPSGRTAWTRSRAARPSAPTSRSPACCTARCCAAPIRTRASNRSTSTRRWRCPASRPSCPASDLVDFPWDKPAILGIQDLRYISRNVMARDKALYAGHAVAAVAATSAKIAAAAAQADRGRLRGAALGHRRRRGAASRARPSCTRTCAKRRRQAGPGDRHPTSPASSSTRWATVEAGLRGRRGHRRAQLQDQARAPGLYRAARLPRQRRQGRPGHHLEQQPGPLHGARHDGPADRHQAQRHPRHPRRDRRRLRRQDHRLSGAAGAGAVAQVGAPGEDGDDRARRCSAPPARRRDRPARSRSAPPRTARSPP